MSGGHVRITYKGSDEASGVAKSMPPAGEAMARFSVQWLDRHFQTSICSEQALRQVGYETDSCEMLKTLKKEIVHKINPSTFIIFSELVVRLSLMKT